MPEELTDEAMAEAMRYIALRYLAVERGHAPARELRKLLTEQETERQPIWGAVRPSGSPPPRLDRDVGAVTLYRNDAVRTRAAVMARDPDERWGVLVIQVHGDGRGRYRVGELTRIDQPELPPRSANPSVARESSAPAAVPELAPHIPVVAQLTGPGRGDPEGQLLQEAIAVTVEAYRARWGINDPHAPLGPPGGSVERVADRQATMGRLHALSDLLERLGPDRGLDTTDLDRVTPWAQRPEASPPPGLDRGV